jgi:hypothetical protein
MDVTFGVVIFATERDQRLDRGPKPSILHRNVVYR